MKKLMAILLTIFLTFCVVSTVQATGGGISVAPAATEVNPFEFEQKMVNEMEIELTEFVLAMDWSNSDLDLQGVAESIGEKLENKWKIPFSRYYIEVYYFTSAPDQIFVDVYITSEIDKEKFYSFTISVDRTQYKK